MKISWNYKHALTQLEHYVAERPVLMKFFLDPRPRGSEDGEDILRQYWHASESDDDFVFALKRDGLFRLFKDEIVGWLQDDYDMLSETLDAYFQEELRRIEQLLFNDIERDIFACQISTAKVKGSKILTYIATDSLLSFLRVLDVHYGNLIETNFTISTDGDQVSIELIGDRGNVTLDAWRLENWLDRIGGQKALTGLHLTTSNLSLQQLCDLELIAIKILEKEGFYGVAQELQQRLDNGESDLFVEVAEYLRIQTQESI